MLPTSLYYFLIYAFLPLFFRGRYLLAGGQDRALAIYDTASPCSRQTSGDKHTCKAVCRVQAGADGGHKYNIETVQWYPFDTGEYVNTQTGPPTWYHALET